MRGYVFELPPACDKWGKTCFHCPHVKCRENENYDGEKFDYDFDPDINRFATLQSSLEEIASVPYKSLVSGTASKTAAPKQNINTSQPLFALLANLAEQHHPDCKSGESVVKLL